MQDLGPLRPLRETPPDLRAYERWERVAILPPVPRRAARRAIRPPPVAGPSLLLDRLQRAMRAWAHREG